MILKKRWEVIDDLVTEWNQATHSFAALSHELDLLLEIESDPDKECNVNRDLISTSAQAIGVSAEDLKEWYRRYLEEIYGAGSL